MNVSAAEEKPKGILLWTLAKLANLFWWLLLAVLVLAALYVGLGRQLTQNINDYRPQIEQQLSELLGQEVLIGSLSSRWNWLNPTIVARDLTVRPEAGSEEMIGSLQSLRVGLDVLATLRRFRIVFSDFDANGLELVINQTPRGAIEVEGVDLPEPIANDLSEWIDLAGQWLSDPSIRITRVALGLRDGSGTLREVEIPQLDLVYRRGLFHASGRAMRPGTTQQLASFRLVGQHFFRGDFTGQFYGDINSGRLFDGLAQEYAWQGIRAEGFDLGGQVWLTFRDGLMEQASGTLRTPYLQLGVRNESLAPLEDIQARFGWRRRDPENPTVPQPATSEPDSKPVPWYSTGEFHLDDLTWRWNGETVPGFSIRFQAGMDADLLIADKLPIGPVTGLVAGLQILPDEFDRALRDYSPSGLLDSVLLRMPAKDDDRFRLTADLRDISVKAFNGTPAVQGLNGSLVINEVGGFVLADSAALTFGFPGLFSGLWEVRDFSAGVAWQFDEETTRVYSDDIAMGYGPESRLTGAFDLKLVANGEDELSLKVGVEDGRADMLAEFVPAGVIDRGLYDWLTTAIEEADIVQGSYFGHGQIGSDAPSGSFVSSMFYDFTNATVKYDERWPEVTGASGRVFVHQGRTRVDLATGQTGGIELKPGQVRVEPGDGAESTMVYIDAAAPVSGDALAYWMQRTPLGELAGDASEKLVVEGRFYLDLGLGIALDSNQQPDVEATVRAESGSLSFPEADLQWTDLSGEVSYSIASGFSSDPISARFLGDAVSVWFRATAAGEGLNVRQAGNISVTALQNRLGLPDNSLPGIDGTLRYEAVLELPAKKTPTIRLMSDLKGVTVDWPAPLGKTAQAIAPLTVTLVPGPEPGLKLNVDWQQRTNLDLSVQSGRVEVAVNDLRLGERRFKDLLVNAVSGSDNWLIRVNSDWIRGQTVWPISAVGAGDSNADSLVKVDLEILSLTRNNDQLAEPAVAPEAENPLTAFRELDVANWPAIDVRIADLQINDESAGIWSLQLKPGDDQINVENIEGRLRSLTLKGGLSWRIDNNEERTGFEGTLNGESLADIGALFAAEIPFRSDKTAIDLNLDWPGRPDQFTVDGLSGSVRMRFDDGVILEGNSTAQLFRVFNLLNSDTLWRRLKLDFSDLYEAGVAFDAISGKARLEEGVLTLDPELQIVGPSGAFKFSGTTDMARETLDMNMVVVLPLTQNLPLAAVLLGAGAPIGGALFVLDKVLGDPLSKLTSATYRVNGSWDEPEVRLKRVFDNSE